jgi:mono/diheme cytochrome c family protein
MLRMLAIVVSTLVMSAAAPATAQKVVGTPEAQVAAGRTLFVTYCATCHGTSGHGDGPLAERFRVRPADLTLLAAQPGGNFIAARMQRIIDGRDVNGHGNGDMPVWGDAFRRREGLDEDAIRARIEAIVRYLESIQQRSS